MFIRKHKLRGSEIKKFDPDYYMAHSWLRLRQGKNIQKHDITMLNHELAEEKEMQDSLDVIYEDSHERVQKVYNYQRELLEYLKEIGVFKERGKGQIDVPDIYLFGLGLKRKGGVRRT